MSKHNYSEVIKSISRIMLEKSMGEDIKQKLPFMKKVVWGAGESGKTFISLNSDLNFDYIVDTRISLQNTKHEGLEILPEDKLYLEDVNSTIVFLPTVIHKQLRELLLEKGFKNFVIPNQINSSGVGFTINKSDIYEFIDWINKENINYAFQKYVTDDIDFSAMKDFDILVASNDIHKVIACPLFFKEHSDDVMSIDIMWSHPIGVSQELPFYTSELVEDILNHNNKFIIKNVMAVKLNILVFMYLHHIVLHKGRVETIDKYRQMLSIMLDKLGITLNLTLEDIYSFIQSSKYRIPIDFARKWAEKTQSPFLLERTKARPLAEQTLAVYIFRDFFKDKEQLLASCLDIIKHNGFKIIKQIILEDKLLENVKSTIRGGVWIDSNHTKVAGYPYLAIVCIHNGINTRKTKVEIRNYVSVKYGSEVNCIHASDDDIEAKEYLGYLGCT